MKSFIQRVILNLPAIEITRSYTDQANQGNLRIFCEFLSRERKIVDVLKAVVALMYANTSGKTIIVKNIYNT